MSIIGDIILLGCGVALGLIPAGRCYIRLRASQAELAAEEARNETMRRDRDHWRSEARRLRASLDGADSYQPRVIRR